MTVELQYLQIEPTTRCNYTCGFCAGRHMNQEDLPLETFKKTIDSIHGLKHLELQGEGESLLHPDFFAMIDYTHEKFPQAKISLISNGSLFTTDNIQRILNGGITTIMVSIESPYDDQFQEIRGGKLSRVKRGITELIAQKSRLNSTLKVGFAVTILKQTVNHINAIGRLYHDLQLDGGIVIQPLQSMTAYRQYYSGGVLKDIPMLEDKKRLQHLIASDAPLIEVLQLFNRSRSFYTDLFSSVSPRAKVCPWLKNGLYITASGLATSCCYIKDIEQYGFENSVDNIENTLLERQCLSDSLSHGEIPPQCNNCHIAIAVTKR